MTATAYPLSDRPGWKDNLPFWSVHALALGGAIYVGWSWSAFWWLLGTYLVRMFAITGGYHRYFSHRTFKTTRVFQFILAILAMSSAQQGVLWWASHHRHHHKYSDEEDDVHSPIRRGFWWSHMLWILAPKNRATHMDRVKDFAKYPELRWLDRHHLFVAVACGFVLYGVGGATGLYYGHFLSLVVAWHCTFFINSLAHVFGSRRYATTDTSRNSFLLAIICLGEGWHNNHHHYQRSARQGFFWWEIDLTFYVLKLLEVMHIVWDVQGVPDHVRREASAPNRKRVKALATAAGVVPPPS